MKSQEEYLAGISVLDQELYARYKPIIVVDSALTRQLVSFQANKQRTRYRWYKYKEAFSADLIAYLLRKYKVPQGKLLDPFAGVGTTLFASSRLGYDADGIELLPVGQNIILAHQDLLHRMTAEKLNILKIWRDQKPWHGVEQLNSLPVLRITKGAYAPQTEREIGQYLVAAENEPEEIGKLLRFALFCVLEAISYTRKDGQYLRWDFRSGRNAGTKPFNKGKIALFEDAITSKLHEIITDLSNHDDSYTLFQETPVYGDIRLFKGSCLNILPTLDPMTYMAVMTSPPYCNRYDYTRTYALELALLGITEAELGQLRQTMLSCTVENRPKDLLALNPQWQKVLQAVEQQPLLQAILQYLEVQREQKALNNAGISRMVKGYFYEMACVIAECASVLKPDGFLFMVNDNVRYAGASISVDLILSALAESSGLIVENILVLPQGKGNSSQQMGGYGREPLRKCVYVWRKPA